MSIIVQLNSNTHDFQMQSFTNVYKILIKKRLQHKCFPVNFVKMLRATFFTKHLWTPLLLDFFIQAIFKLLVCHNPTNPRTLCQLEKFWISGKFLVCVCHSMLISNCGYKKTPSAIILLTCKV